MADDRVIVAALLLAATGLAAPAEARDAVFGGWRLERRRRSCFIEAATDRGTYAKIEYDPFHIVHYMTISALPWSDVVDTRAYRVGLAFANTARVELAGTGVRDAESPRALVIFTLPRLSRYSASERQFVHRMRFADTLRLDLDGSQPVMIDARGLRAAVPALQACGNEIRHRRISP